MGSLAIKAWCVRELNGLHKKIEIHDTIPEEENL
jgi:hypothetical protein